MPGEQINRTQFIQLAVLILAVPAQYFLTRSSNENNRQYELKKVITGLSELSQSYFSWDGWIQWCGSVLMRWRGETETDHPVPEEVLKNHHKDGHFATSMEPRSPRSPQIKFRVGQVVKHRLNGYRAVIVGWDEVARAPEEWINEMHPADKPTWRKMPNYAVLVDTRDRLTPQMAYVVEENIEVVTNMQIFHPLVEHYFETFDGAQYIARPWLAKVYPHD